MVFCNNIDNLIANTIKVTILILVDGFLQYNEPFGENESIHGHNPYFSRWFSAIVQALISKTLTGTVTILILVDGFLQYDTLVFNCSTALCHNPYFSRWFSAIAAKISQNFTFLCKKLVFSDSFCELYFTQPLYINYCTNYLNTFLLKLAKIKAIINII